LCDCAMLNLTVRVVCRGIVEGSVGCEDAHLVEEMGVGVGGTICHGGTLDGIRGASCPNSIVAKSGAKLGCTLGGVRGDPNGDRIRLHALRTGGELHSGRGATCVGKVSAAKRGALVVLAAS
jgi:hypothetical protein